MDWRKSGWPENRQAFAKFRYIRLDAAFSKSPQTISRGLPERRKFVIKLARIRQNHLPEQDNVGAQCCSWRTLRQTGKITLVLQILSAASRAALVGFLVLWPCLIIPAASPDGNFKAVSVAFAAGLFVFVEYVSRSPSLIAFRYSPPCNRVRFGVLAMLLIVSTLIFRGEDIPFLTEIASRAGTLLDFPYSPVSFLLQSLGIDAQHTLSSPLRDASSLALLLAITMVCGFVFVPRMAAEHPQRSDFNIYLNLPTFDPTRCSDVVEHLRWSASMNIGLGVLFPVFGAQCGIVFSQLLHPITVDDPLTLIWITTLWVFFSFNLIMRGVWMGRIARMVEGMRKRRYVELGQPSSLA